MKALKKSVSMLLTAVLTVVLLAACSNNSSNESAPSKEPQSSATGQSATNADEYTVKIVFVGPATSEAIKEVAAAASAITKEKFNTNIELVRLDYGSFQQGVNLMFSGNEQFDLMPNFAFNTATAANSGQILDLDDLLAKKGKDLLEQISDEDWRAMTVGGKIYAVPNNKEKAQGYGIAMATEMLEGIGYDASTIKSQDDLEELFKAIKAKYPTVHPLVSDNGLMGQMPVTKDDLGYDFGVLENGLDASNTTVVNWFASETYKKQVELRYKWAKQGLIMPDASTNTESAGSLIGAGKGFSAFTNTKPGIEAEWQRKAGKPMTVVELVKPFSTTSGVSNQWYISYTSKKPERAMEVLNEMYINPELADILVNGIEGKHYVKDTTAGVLSYPEGVDASNTSYSSVAWAWLNELITTPWEADGASIWKDTIAFNESASPSVAKGFMWNNSNVLNEITASNNVIAKFANAIESGMLDPATTLPKFVQELNDAGVQKIVDEKQLQLNKWLEENK
ncbi:ABC transporter substrate-binding protein [Cohnella abietis]|uniref:ABC transporter substrate-binding protein n=1 Tax=Cohnella abietis TaxID=2507935 RepID=A0A3T1D1I9_9BACL|nr:ABC transporter substrate-binding protein [Cohnella abietis]BBI31982.1 ABC transporter substrate-binding protein [Cohnella abietis]